MENGWRKKLADEISRQGREMKEVSVAAGLGETYVRDAIKRGRGKLENLRKVAVVLGKPADWLADAITIPPSGRTMVIPPPNATEPHAAPRLGQMLPVYGVGVGGEDGRYRFNGERIGNVERPPILDGVANAYAVFVAGESMVPRYRPGETVWVHPHLPVKRGDDVIVQLHPENEADPPEGYIKEFVTRTPSMVILKQYNPECEIEIDRALVKSIHVIVGSLKA
jgi:phage repressor protein C with HTH and peptisase S24 domain